MRLTGNSRRRETVMERGKENWKMNESQNERAK